MRLEFSREAGPILRFGQVLVVFGDEPAAPIFEICRTETAADFIEVQDVVEGENVAINERRFA